MEVKLNEIGLRKGILINFIAKYSNIFVQIIITSILARLLTPKEFGIISVIAIFIAFFNLLGDMGIGPAVIQYKDLTDDDISSIFIFTFFIAIFLGFLFYFFSYFIADFYNNSVYINIGHLLSISVIINLLCTVPNGILLKNKQFKLIGIATLLSNFTSGLITILLAYKGFSYYALVANSIMQVAFYFLIIFRYSNIRIKLKKYSFTPIKRISNFSVYQFLFNIVNYFSRNSDNLLIGKYLGMAPLGYYDKAYKLMLYPVQNLTFVITPVLQPILSDYQNDKDEILNQYKKIVKILALLGAFISVFCFFSAKEIILIMFGKQWTGSINTFKILSITIVIQMVLSSTGSIFQATGNTYYLFISGLSGAFIMLSAIIIGLFFGKIEYVAFAIMIAYFLNLIQGFYFLIIKVFNKNLINFFKIYKSTVIIIFIMIIFYVIFLFHIKIYNLFISLVFKLLLGTFAYILGILLTNEYQFLLKVLFKKY